MRYWEDFEVGHEAEHGSRAVTEEEIVAFAREYDPQPFHLDPEAAAASPFGGLIASGWHTAAIYMGLYVRNAMGDVAGMGSPGVEELRHAYRVPAEIMELALPLLDRIAPDVEPPLAYRKGGDRPLLVRVAEDELIAAALREAGSLAERDGLLAVIAPRALAAGTPSGDAFDEASVPVLTPRQAKGLEFDHVVVVEPAAIAEDGEQGLRELYVALTRPTKTLVVVHARPLPEGLGVAA